MNGEFKELSYKKVDNKYFIRIATGGEVMSLLQEFCAQENIELGIIHALGASSHLKIGRYSSEIKDYIIKEHRGHLEICNFYGNITMKDGEQFIHSHITFSDEGNRAFGGHLYECFISATFEGVIEVTDSSIGRRFDENIGIFLCDI